MKAHLEDVVRVKRIRGKDKAKERFIRNGKVSSKHIRYLENREREKNKQFHR